MARRLKEVMEPHLKGAYQEGYEAGLQEGYKRKNTAYEKEITCLKEIALACKPGWISVEERLPEKEGWYQVFTSPDKGHKSINKARYSLEPEWSVNAGKGRWHGSGGTWTNVTHWMHMPKGPEALKRTIDSAPTVDVIQVVRCKNCKWGATPYGDEHDGWTECTNLCGRPLMPDEGFCSYGERRTDEYLSRNHHHGTGDHPGHPGVAEQNPAQAAEDPV